MTFYVCLPRPACPHARASRAITRVSTLRRVLRRLQRTNPAAFAVAVQHFR